TILFESADAVPAPTATPPFLPDDTLTPPPATATPAPTPAATETPAAQASAEPSETPATPTEEATVEPAATAETAEPADANAPMLLNHISFAFPGFTQPLTIGDTESVLHPAELMEALYVPLLEILQNAGNVVIQNSNGDQEETAFAVLTDFYQISYSILPDGGLSGLVLEKNTTAQPLANRSAFLLDGVLYLPMEDMANRTGIAFAVDDATGIITVTMPTAGT
ncbi:MAG: hypothetical protein IH607_08760, partial [Firmicutes bacterium]|nr:hypothetical protein [Bacillota bacterium]